MNAVTVFMKLETWAAEHWGAEVKLYNASLAEVIDVANKTYLASEFGDPDGLVECVVKVLNISDERLRIGTVPMDSNGINLEKINQLELLVRERDAHDNRHSC